MAKRLRVNNNTTEVTPPVATTTKFSKSSSKKTIADTSGSTVQIKLSTNKHQRNFLSAMQDSVRTAVKFINANNTLSPSEVHKKFNAMKDGPEFCWVNPLTQAPINGLFYYYSNLHFNTNRPGMPKIKFSLPEISDIYLPQSVINDRFVNIPGFGKIFFAEAPATRIDYNGGSTLKFDNGFWYISFKKGA